MATTADPPVTVVIVDDQRPFRRAACAVIGRTEGFAVIGEAETGEAGVDLVLSQHPALVLMDVNLPGISGLEATRRILAEAPDIVVFVCSTYGLGELPSAMRATGARAYIDKQELDTSLLRRLWDGCR